MDLLAALDGSALASWLRGSFWIYPIVNTLHVLGVALLVGAILPLDARLLGAWRQIPLDHFTTTILPFAALGCVIALASGPLLFVVQPFDYVAKPVFWAKMALVAGGLGNVLLLRRSRAWRSARAHGATTPPPRLRLAGAVSLATWLIVLVLGRLLAYV